MATREAYGFALKRLGSVNPHVVAVSCDVKNSTFSEFFGDAYPDRFCQGYIAEQNMISVGVGLAARGKVQLGDTFACSITRIWPGAHGRHRPARISIYAVRIAASRLVRMALRRWRLKISR